MSIEALFNDPNFEWEPFNLKDQICPLSRKKIKWPVLVNNYLLDLEAAYKYIKSQPEGARITVPMVGILSENTIKYIVREYEYLQKTGEASEAPEAV